MNPIKRARTNHQLIATGQQLLLFILLLILQQGPSFAQQPKPAPDPSRLTVESIFTYRTRSLGPVQWQQDGAAYLALEPSPGKKGFLDIVRYDALTGDRTIKLSAEKLTPASASEPLLVENFDLSEDGQKLLVFTKSERVWRSNTRGDYWVVDLKDGSLRKLGGTAAKPSTLMFAKFSPDATRVAYVRENNIYVETLTGADGSNIKQITNDGSKYIVNGTFDWVYEEELFCRDGFRWSPDGKHIAFWQLNSEGVKEFQLINNTAGLYPVIISFPYPKAGETNSAARVGVVRATGGATRWFDIAGDPRNNYLPRMEWAASSDEVVIQQLNRLQNTNIVMLGDIRTGKVRPILTEKDTAWVDVGWGDLDWNKTGLARGDVEWINAGKRLLWTSERDGWRHIYSVSRDGSDVKNITPGDYDVMGVEKVDAANGWLYFRASPENSGQRYLYRTRLTGEGKAERLSSEPGTHAYNISPRGDLAMHYFSTFNRVPKTEIIRLPDHTVARVLIDNAALQERIEK
ncbi:MAG TPA: DPP IV N-terminal domain-containing protein, partial [Pyrinomonadaceae bacterium]|nr:DPP IV N-terminal domain-containing protein [Pyrinomonadaceae bacterium]